MRCAILTNMEPVDVPLDDERWTRRWARWSGELRRLRLDGVVSALLDAGAPLAPLGAHLLWVAQPTLGLFVPRDDVAALARLLEQPGGLEQVRRHLLTEGDTVGFGPDDDDE